MTTEELFYEFIEEKLSEKDQATIEAIVVELIEEAEARGAELGFETGKDYEWERTHPQY